MKGTAMPIEADDDRDPPAGWGVPTGVVAGASIGMLVGILREQLAVGLTVGAAIGLLVGTLLTAAAATPVDRRPSVLAVAIALVTAGALTVLLILLR